jgi:hypothetical protein
MGKPNMIKRADGSYSQRGLWDNIRANKGSGKAPTKEMLKQERKIKAKHADGGTIDNQAFAYDRWKRSLPDNLQNNDPAYNLKGYWEGLNRPEKFQPFEEQMQDDGYYHASTRNPETGEYYKGKAHPTTQHAINEDIKMGYYPQMKNNKIYTNKFGMGGTNNSGFKALPQNVQQKILANMAEGGTIHIKPENRGKFTAYKERTGKTTEEALHSPNAHVRQMANFAKNAAKWKHADGGLVLQENMYYDGGLTGEPDNSPRNSLMASGNFETNPNMSKYGLNTGFDRTFGKNRNLNLGVNANLGATYNNMPSTQGEFSMPMTPTVEPTANFGATGSYNKGNNNFNANVNYNPYNQGVEGRVTYTKKFGMGGMASPKYRYDNGKFLPMHNTGTTVGTPPPTKWGANAAKANPNATALAGMAPAVMEVANTFVNQNTDPELSGALDWGAKGMAAGSAFGPWGAVIGGTAGLIGGGVKGVFDRQTMETADAEKKIAAKNAADYKTVMGEANNTNTGAIQANTGFGYAAFGGMKYNNGFYANGGMTVINRDHPNPQEEVEGGESAMLPNGKNVQFKGPKHTNGGIKTSLPEGTRIFSDQLIYPGKK